MESLPDDVLLEVMQYVAVPDLFACRLVCKRFLDLVQHGDVWRLRQLDETDPWMCTVLRLAPCLEEMRLALPLKRCHTPFTTKCAVADLALDFRDSDTPLDAVQAAFVIRHQAALGRLKRIEVSYLELPYFEWAVLSGTLASTAGLEALQLDVRVIGSPAPAPVLHGAVSTASLEAFFCILVPELEPFCRCILTVHSATLHVVTLNDHWRDQRHYSTTTATWLAPRLAGMPNLTHLQCTLLPGMEALATCSSLRSVRIDVQSNAPELIRGAAAFLRHATQLRQVCLLCINPSIHPLSDVGKDLVVALASSGKSRVMQLSISYPNKNSDADFSAQPPVEALSSLPVLESLSITGLPEEVLPGISPTTTPALRTLAICPVEPPKGCAHAWMHSDAVRAVLSLNPLLHIKLSFSKGSCQGELCQWCSMGCHRDMWGFKRIAVFSHDPSVKCLQNHSDDRFWIHVSH
ncbi:uncharacterized protein LOC113207318 isoform X2 [Frankliniella occidentalis]|nr:uncharacterized protein LOC113207318 isoform X2 [Frankliniella occidentalis]